MKIHSNPRRVLQLHYGDENDAASAQEKLSQYLECQMKEPGHLLPIYCGTKHGLTIKIKIPKLGTNLATMDTIREASNKSRRLIAVQIAKALATLEAHELPPQSIRPKDIQLMKRGADAWRVLLSPRICLVQLPASEDTEGAAESDSEEESDVEDSGSEASDDSGPEASQTDGERSRLQVVFARICTKMLTGREPPEAPGFNHGVLLERNMLVHAALFQYLLRGGEATWEDIWGVLRLADEEPKDQLQTISMVSNVLAGRGHRSRILSQRLDQCFRLIEPDAPTWLPRVGVPLLRAMLDPHRTDHRELARHGHLTVDQLQAAYRGNTVVGLIRLMRNLIAHYAEAEQRGVSEAVGPSPDELVEFFGSRFPRLYHVLLLQAQEEYPLEIILPSVWELEESPGVLAFQIHM